MAPLFLPQASLASEEVAEELGAFIGEDAGGDFDAVVEAIVFAELIEGADRAGFGVVAAVDEFGDAGIDDCASAHGAGFEGDDQGAVEQTPVALGLAGLAHGEDFGVGGGVVLGFALIETPADDFLRGEMDDDATDGDFVEGESLMGAGDGFAHPALGINRNVRHSRTYGGHGFIVRVVSDEAEHRTSNIEH